VCVCIRSFVRRDNAISKSSRLILGATTSENASAPSASGGTSHVARSALRESIDAARCGAGEGSDEKKDRNFPGGKSRASIDACMRSHTYTQCVIARAYTSE